MGSRLVIGADRTDWLAEIHCSGQVCESTVAELQPILGLAILSRVPVVRLDLRLVESIDASGVECLLDAAAACEGKGQTLELVPGGAVLLLLEGCGVADEFKMLLREPGPDSAVDEPRWSEHPFITGTPD
jgi:anti-anti-sigma regulatory factor